MTSIPLGVSLCTEISKYGWPPKSEKVMLMYTNVHIYAWSGHIHMYILYYSARGFQKGPVPTCIGELKNIVYLIH